MSEFTYAGSYIQEVSSGPGPISGVTTSNLGLIGYTPRGPVNYPTLVSDYSEFSATFGTFTADGLLPTMAYAFFQNGGKRLYVVRVTHADAVKAYWDYEQLATNVSLTTTAQVSGRYALNLQHLPVKATTPGTVTIVFENATAALVNGFRDDGAGALVFDAALSGASAGGGSGSIDYVTGEVTVQLTVPGQFTGSTKRVLGSYTYRVLRFQMQWPGAEGNYFRALIEPGSDDYMTAATASWSRFTVSVQEDLNQDPANRSWSTKETFADMVFNDPTSKSYVETVMNDTISGSKYVTVTDYGNPMNPPELAGTAYTAENLYTNQQHSDGSSTVVPTPYDGAWKGWLYDLGHSVSPSTFHANFQFIEDGTRIGTAATPASATPIFTWTPAALVANSVTVYGNISGVGVTPISDDGAGNLVYGVTTVGSVNYVTGEIAIDLTPATATFVAGSAITLDATYAGVVPVIDDGSGGLSIGTLATGAPTKFELNTAGENSIDYDTGEVVLTWKIDGNPAAGPCGTFVLSTAAQKTSTAGPWTLTPGMSFNLTADAESAVAVSFSATQGYVDSTNAWPVADQDGKSITFLVNGAARTVTFSGVTTTEAAALLQINAQVPGVAAYDQAGNMRIISDRYGTGSSVTISANTSAITFASPVAGTGNVANIEAVMASEYKAAVELATVASVTVGIDGSQTTEGVVLGSAGLLTFADVTSGCLAALGITAPLTVYGTDSLTGGELAASYSSPTSSLAGVMTSGANGSATDSDDIVGANLAANLEGLYAFGKGDEMMQLVAADFQTDTYVIDALLTYAELMKDKFILCAVPHGLSYQAAVSWKRYTLNRYSSYGAVYYPHVKIKDPSTKTNIDVPPCGHVAGVFARTDANKNVGKAPAGTQDGLLAWSVGLEYDLTPTQTGVVYEQKINPLVNWSYTGRCVWGARTMDQAGGEWPYIQMRRLFMFVEKSVFRSTHVHAFENNGPQLWNQITIQLVTFLAGLYQGGYFAGSTQDDSFFVICNRSNNPQNTVDQGFVFCDVGIAPNKPAEYLVFRFSQKSLS